MTLRQDIREAQAKAATEEAHRSLRAQRRNFASLDSLMNARHEVDAVLSMTDRGNNWLLVLPVLSEKSVALEDNFSDAVGKALAEYNPTQTEHEGFVAYEINKVDNGRLPKKLEIDAAGLNFQLGIVRTDLQSSPRRRSRSSSNSRAITGEQYVPQVKRGDEFDVSLTTTSPGKYSIITLDSDERAHFPGYRIPFTLSYKGEEIETHVASAPRGTEVGVRAGTFISKGMPKLYKEHPEIGDASKIRFKVVKPGKVYEIVRVN